MSPSDLLIVLIGWGTSIGLAVIAVGLTAKAGWTLIGAWDLLVASRYWAAAWALVDEAIDWARIGIRRALEVFPAQTAEQERARQLSR